MKPSGVESGLSRSPSEAPSEESSTSSAADSFKNTLNAALQSGPYSPRGLPRRSPLQRSATDATTQAMVSSPVVVQRELATGANRGLAKSVTAREAATVSTGLTQSTSFSRPLPEPTPLANSSRIPSRLRFDTSSQQDNPAQPGPSPLPSPRSAPEGAREAAAAAKRSTPLASPLSSPRNSPEPANGSPGASPTTSAASIEKERKPAGIAATKRGLFESKGYSSAQSEEELLTALIRTIVERFPDQTLYSDAMVNEVVCKLSNAKKLMLVEIGLQCVQTPDIFGVDEAAFKLQTLVIQTSGSAIKSLGAVLND